LEKSSKKELYSWIWSLTLAIVIAFLCRTYIFTPTTVYGESMSPTFENKDRVLISKITDIEHFDMIVFAAPDSDEHYIKRVIGLPGDSVEMRDDVLYINGEKKEEPYLESSKEGILFGKLTGDFTLEELTGHKTVPEGSLFVMGDNRLISKDSRSFGFVPMDSVDGEVKLRIYPLGEIGIPK